MKITLMSLILNGCIISCMQQKAKDSNTPLTPMQLMEQAILAAESYALEQLDGGRKTTSPGGMITFEDSTYRYVLEPGRVYTGLISEDDLPDAIVTLATYQGPVQTTSEHLILLYSNDALVLKKVVKSNMDILRIQDRIIAADVPTHDRNSPLFDCESCRDVIQYRFEEGELTALQ